MMDKKEILRKVGGILTELNDQYEYLSQSQDNLNDLELELFSANANFLSDHLSILVKLNDSNSRNSGTTSTTQDEPHIPLHEEGPSSNQKLEAGAPEVEPPVEYQEAPETLPDQSLEPDEASGLTLDSEQKPADMLFDQQFDKEERSFILDGDVTEKKVDEEFVHLEEKKDKEIKEEIGDQEQAKDDIYINESGRAEPSSSVPGDKKGEEISIPTVNDLLSKNITHQTVASQFNSRQSKDLKSMISLNDKLLFVRDLFNGYSLAYSEAVELLNRFDNFEAAENFLKQNYAPKNNWASKQDVTDKFYEILNRRYSK